ncbi:MAG TPA: amino acid ABC transporter permease [Alphaproteobacteria bacterium]|nr:amino acid ABC transporter permease [Alphaproteobacteria bacterium]
MVAPLSRSMTRAIGRRVPSGRRVRFWITSDALWTSILPTLATLALLAWVASLIQWDFVASLDFSVIWKYRYALFQGVSTTLGLTFVSVSLGLLVGTAFAIALQTPLWPLRWVITAYIELLRNTPLVVQLFWVHFAMPLLTGLSTTPFESGIIAMSLQSSAYLADIAKAGIQAIPKGQWEAAAALGLSRRTTWVKVILPQAIKIVIPPLANIAIGYFKSSSVLVLLSVGELMTVASRISMYSFKPIETLTFVGLVYLVLGYGFSSATYRLEAFYKKAER